MNAVRMHCQISLAGEYLSLVGNPIKSTRMRFSIGAPTDGAATTPRMITHVRSLKVVIAGPFTVSLKGMRSPSIDSCSSADNSPTSGWRTYCRTAHFWERRRANERASLTSTDASKRVLGCCGVSDRSARKLGKTFFGVRHRRALDAGTSDFVVGPTQVRVAPGRSRRCPRGRGSIASAAVSSVADLRRL